MSRDDVEKYLTDEDDGITCDCGQANGDLQATGSRARGWKGKLPVALDGNTWPIDFAAKLFGCSEKDLRDQIRIVELEPAGTLKMASYRRSGRHPRAYDASKLVELWDGIQELKRKLNS